jgi:hypothetical protein
MQRSLLMQLLVQAILLVDAASRAPKGYSNANTKTAKRSDSEFYSVIALMFAAVVGPALLMLLYALWADPGTKDIAKELWRRAKLRFANLSKQSAVETKKQS